MATYYVDNANGNDGNDGLSEGNAWATLEKAADTVAAGDKVFVQGGTSYTTQDGANNCIAQLGVDGTAIAFILWEGYTTTPGDDGVAVIDANTNSLANCIAGGTFSYNLFKNLQFTGASGVGVLSTGDDRICFENCEFDNNGSDGCDLDNNIDAINCSFHNNTGDGFQADVGCLFVNCSFYDNGAYGISCWDGIVVFSLFYGNTSGGVNFTAAAAGGFGIVINSTIDGETIGKGVYWSTGGNIGEVSIAVVNNIIYDLATGLESATQDMTAGNNVDRVTVKNNLFNSNVADGTQFPTGDDTQAGAPAFTNEAGADYTLGSGSPAIDTGYDKGF